MGLQWDPWLELESQVESYELCFQVASSANSVNSTSNATSLSNVTLVAQNTSEVCVNVGNETRVLVRSPCACPWEESLVNLTTSEQWLEATVETIPTLLSAGLQTIQVSLTATNVVGLTTEIAAPSVIFVDEPPQIFDVRLSPHPSNLVDGNESVCSALGEHHTTKPTTHHSPPPHYVSPPPHYLSFTT